MHADDTPVPVLCPGRGTTRQGRLRTYVRDDRPVGLKTPPAEWFACSSDRKGVYPFRYFRHLRHLRYFAGVLQADRYVTFDQICKKSEPKHSIREAACWAHVRRKFYDIKVATDSPVAGEALVRIGARYSIETEVRGQAAAVRRQIRKERVGPTLDALHQWIIAMVTQLSKKFSNRIRRSAVPLLHELTGTLRMTMCSVTVSVAESLPKYPTAWE